MIDLPPDLALLLDTPRLRLIPLTVDEANDLVVVLTDPRLAGWPGGDGGPPSEERVRDRLAQWRRRRSVDGHRVRVSWVVRLVPSGEAVGCCQVLVDDRGVGSLGYLVGPDWAGRGLGTEAVSAVLRVVRGVLRVVEVRAPVPPGNAPARRLAARCGLLPTGSVDARGWEVWSDAAPLGGRTLTGVPQRVALGAAPCPTTASSSPVPGSTTSRTST